MDDRTGGPEEPPSDIAEAIQQAWARERPHTPVASIGVITRIWRIGKLLDEDRRETMLRLGMDSATLDLLSTLRRAGPPYRLPPGELARRSLVSAGAISQRVARSEREGLVRRLRSPDDGRGVLVELTEAGHAEIERTVDDLLRHEEDLISALSQEQRDQLSGLLRILLGSLAGDRESRAKPA
ncbi:MarR family transcriptional regulator [Amycolatopsis acidiphila]|uniref:MarR family transcriptional regulator n=1 Tax=Amycolatopsis acidiphila TaxID=715473 RepID=A0A557ZK04_9PSEU|nr:MarR family transcriptional regulator [Amycolatopsis acidiphila]TVT12354.1 MarR family transcriptional regulator [Amycolatopsis acidiphila]UIJ59046.1 MarR family transcriptional regulator [Amycolatopsis acidiphila]GHG73564.1 MarR family transcriptional regulator [Amycolatopsis acidiphila]